MKDPLISIQKQWRACNPTLDTSPMEVVGRILFTAKILEERLAMHLEKVGLTLGAFDVLATLRRQGSPYELTPTGLYRELLLSSGAMTNRVNGLVRQGLVERHPDPVDRRGFRIRLTGPGLSLIDSLMPEHLATEQRLLASMTKAEQKSVARLLSNWLTALPP
jgi:DNA-binding MarR family transcriptional regulator